MCDLVSRFNSVVCHGSTSLLTVPCDLDKILTTLTVEVAQVSLGSLSSHFSSSSGISGKESNFSGPQYPPL